MPKRRRYSLRRPKSNVALNQAPGTVTYIGRKSAEDTKLEVIDYNPESFERFTSTSPQDAFKFEEEKNVTWINIDGLNNISEIEKVGKYYGLHALMLEDVVNTNQRPKFDEYEDFVFMVIKMLYHDADGQLVNEHLSLVLGKDYVLTFQEADGDVFEAVRERITQSTGRIRNKGADYLMFSLLDAVIDSYFSVIEVLSDKIESLEDQLFLATAGHDVIFEIQELKREILRIRRAVLPLREVIGRLEKLENNLIDPKTKKYIRDLYDHILQVSENIEIYREMAWGLMDMYMTTISNKMNEVMKVLTIMASIFIPLTFIAGIYGMNFEYMPELEWKYSYFFLLGIMLLVVIGMLIYFKKKDWL
ncbi:MAG TPA: magnesium/cobalt transporter CorA [Salinimicrobium sp.]|nr:magnesium/cobalt transporter CorA [Salinimicrobium sp.]